MDASDWQPIETAPKDGSAAAMITGAFQEPQEIGKTIEYLGRRFEVTRQISRSDWWIGVQERRRTDLERDGVLERAGFYNTETKEFKPTHDEPAPDYKYCYWLKPLS